MPYSELMIRPFREELTRVGVEETRTPEEVEAALATDGTVMVVVNSVCGCAAGKARPGIAKALQSPTLPDKVVTVFAGADIEATERARGYFAPYQPSSPQIALLRDKKVLFMLERHQIQDRTADQIASELSAAFEAHCK
jgi:putative YphP/YqiW family bacilliredoxin